MNSQLLRQQSTKAIKIFICSAYDVYKDNTILEELIKHLSPLKQQGHILYWYARMVSPGKETIHEIDNHLNEADIILLMISPDFINSDYYYNGQMQHALERHKTGEARVIPIILRPVDWKDTPLGILQPLPTDGKPITTWPNRDAALLDVANGIKDVIKELTTNMSVDESPTPKNPQISEENQVPLFSHVTLMIALISRS